MHSQGTPFRENLRGIAAISACNLLFLVNDTLLKLANSELPLSEILFLRGIGVSILLLPILIATGAWRKADHLPNWAVFWRTVAEIGAAIFYLVALFRIPIANANAILQVVPLMVTAAGALLLGEVVGWRRWTAIAVGFAGVLVIVRPGLAGFDVFSLVALMSMLFITLRDVATRLMPRGLPALLVAAVTGVMVGTSGLVLGFALGEAWVFPSGRSVGLVAAASCFLLGGYVTAVDFMRHGQIAVVAPFRYTVIVWAMIVGYLVWREVPDAGMLFGTAIVIATGVYTLYRERRTAALVAEARAGEGM